jgi:hypothetical protein
LRVSSGNSLLQMGIQVKTIFTRSFLSEERIIAYRYVSMLSATIEESLARIVYFVSLLFLKHCFLKYVLLYYMDIQTKGV